MMGERFHVGRAGYGEINDTQDVVSVKRDWTDGTIGSLAGEARILDAFGPKIIDELRRGTTIIVADSLTDPRVGPDYSVTWESIGTRSLIVVPMIREKRLRAVFYLHEPEPRHWTEAEAVLARDVAERTWEAVERARAETSLRENKAVCASLSMRAAWRSGPMTRPPMSCRRIQSSIDCSATRLMPDRRALSCEPDFIRMTESGYVSAKRRSSEASVTLKVSSAIIAAMAPVAGS